MGYCGECDHWRAKPPTDGLKTSDQGVCDVSGIEANNMRHGCMMYVKRRALSEVSPIEKYKMEQAEKNR